jgi:hypothetical protein
MAMTKKVSARLDPLEKADLETTMRRNGWTKPQAIREAIWAVAESEGLVRRTTKPGKGWESDAGCPRSGF